MRLSKAIEAEGIFWLSDYFEQDKGYFGTLNIDIWGFATLTLKDLEGHPLKTAMKKMFQRPFSSTSEELYENEYRWITGIVQHNRFAFFNRCIVTGIRTAGLPLEYRLNVTRVYLTDRIASNYSPMPNFDIEPSFTSFVCEMEGLREWLGISGFQEGSAIWNWQQGDMSEPLEVYYQKPEDIETHVKEENISLTFKIQPAISDLPFSGSKLTLEETAAIEGRTLTGSSLSFDDLINHWLTLRAFFDLVVDEPVSITDIKATPAKSWVSVKNEPLLLSIYMPLGFQVSPPSLDKNRHFKYESQEKLEEMLTIWYQKYRVMERAVWYYFRFRSDSPETDAYGAFPLMMTGLEALHTSLGLSYNKKAKSAAQARIVHLLEDILPIDMDAEEIAGVMQCRRNTLVHPYNRKDELRPSPSRSEIVMYYKVCLAAFKYHLLSLLGLDKAVLQRTLRHLLPIRKS